MDDYIKFASTKLENTYDGFRRSFITDFLNNSNSKFIEIKETMEKSRNDDALKTASKNLIALVKDFKESVL